MEFLKGNGFIILQMESSKLGSIRREEGTGRPTKKDRRDLDELEIGETEEEKEDL